MIKAIETTYNGHKFRSRLEARWAVFFDEVGIEYEYEPEGFEIEYAYQTRDEHHKFHDHIKKWKYLPDFFLTKTQTWAEVKGDFLSVDWDMIPHLIDWGGQLPFVGDSHFTERGLLFLGQIPSQLNSCHTPIFPLLQHSKGGWINGAYFAGNKLVQISQSDHYFDSTWGNQAVDTIRDFILDHLDRWNLNTIPQRFMVDAFARARQARFEHGQTIKR